MDNLVSQPTTGMLDADVSVGAAPSAKHSAEESHDMAELRSYKTVEDAAIAWVVARELREGAAPRTSALQAPPYDVDSPPRAIEMKAFGGSTRGFGWLETSQVEELTRTRTSTCMSSKTSARATRTSSS